ncbi:hypothetical protein EPN42_10975 [bacterium]|nr:MAG: hypothetical protein EPN42_10975 [bacterium]
MSHEEWLAARRLGIGSSDAAVVACMSSWSTPYKLYLEKRGEIEPEDISEKPWIEWGNILEEPIAQKFAREHPEWKVRRINFILRHHQYPFMLANLDRDVFLGGIEPVVLEIKTARSADGWGDSGSSEIPESYYVQVQHQLAVTGRRFAYVAALIAGSDYREYLIERNEEDIANLIALETDFWRRVEQGVPPDPSTVSDVVTRWPKVKGVAKEATPEIAMLVDRYRELNAGEKAKEEVKHQIVAFLGEADVLTIGGQKLATFSTKSTGRIDEAALAAQEPELFRSFLVPAFDANAFKAARPDAAKAFVKTTREFRVAS